MAREPLRSARRALPAKNHKHSNQIKGFVALSRCWIVERTIAWPKHLRPKPWPQGVGEP